MKIFQMMVDRQAKSLLLPFDVGEAVKSKTTKEAGLRVNSVIHTDNRICATQLEGFVSPY